MPASTKDTARDASIYLGAVLHEKIYGRVEFPTRAARNVDAICTTYTHSTTLSNDKEYKSKVAEIAQQIASGIIADFPDGFQCVEIGYPEIQDQFGEVAISRAQVMGIFVAVLTRPVGKSRMQLTVLTRATKWQQSPK